MTDFKDITGIEDLITGVTIKIKNLSPEDSDRIKKIDRQITETNIYLADPENAEETKVFMRDSLTALINSKQALIEKPAYQPPVYHGKIDSADSEATSKLAENIDILEKKQELMKKMNKIAKAFRKNPESLEKSDLTDHHKDIIRNLQPDFAGRVEPFPTYQLTNNNANLKRLKGRLSTVSRHQNDETKVLYSNHDITITDNVEDDRVQIEFPGKPDYDVREKLKGPGFAFKWSPRNQAWQRKRSDNASYAAKMMGEYFDELYKTDTSSFEEQITHALKWQGAALKVDMMYDDNDKKARLQHSHMTTKGNLDNYLMRKFNLDPSEARQVSNKLVNYAPDMSANVEDFKDEPWVKALFDPKRHLYRADAEGVYAVVTMGANGDDYRATLFDSDTKESIGVTIFPFDKFDGQSGAFDRAKQEVHDLVSEPEEVPDT